MPNPQKEKRQHRMIRHRRVRSRIIGTTERPRLSVFRSHQWMFAQVIDDSRARTLVSAYEKSEKLSGKPAERARRLGAILAERCKEKGITAVVFDRGGYAYHGRVAAFAEGAREGGLQF
jgi:large subunit ribosomal protein L18